MTKNFLEEYEIIIIIIIITISIDFFSYFSSNAKRQIIWGSRSAIAFIGIDDNHDDDDFIYVAISIERGNSFQSRHSLHFSARRHWTQSTNVQPCSGLSRWRLWRYGHRVWGLNPQSTSDYLSQYQARNLATFPPMDVQLATSLHLTDSQSTLAIHHDIFLSALFQWSKFHLDAKPAHNPHSCSCLSIHSYP